MIPDPARFGTHVAPTAWVTAGIPPIGGRIKERPEDFFVEEQPLYAPSGSGEHIYLFVERRSLSTLDAVRRLARHFGVRERDIGFAGLKDKRAVTRQVFSVHAPGRRVEDVPSLRDDRMTVLWVDRHVNKLRRGHLAANRFSIRIRGVDPTRVLHARAALEQLARVGVPNRIGEQRFGYLGRNHLIGRAILLGDWAGALDALLRPEPGVDDGQRSARELYARGDHAAALAAFSRSSRAERRALQALARGEPPERAVRAVGEMDTGFFLTAFQSAVFNAVLDRRVRDGTLGRLDEGDIAVKHDNRAAFKVTAAVASDPATTDRLARFEISPSGPMWGADMLRASGPTDERELAALASAGVAPADLSNAAASGWPMTGERRALRVPMTDPDVEGGIDEHGPYIRVAFDLPRGAFATAVLREIMKPDDPDGSGIGADEE